MKALFSFLGTNPYAPVKYYLTENPSEVSEEVPYVEEAIVELLGPFDKVIVFGTKESREGNWERRVVKVHKDRSREYAEDGLQRRLQKLKERGLIHQEYKFKEIPLGKDEEEIWEVVLKLYEEAKSLEKGSELYFDITHCFRSIPMISLIFLEFVRQVKEFDIHILYGAFEARKNGKAPIIDLTIFEEGLRWIFATREFKKLGISSEFHDIANEPLKSLSKEYGGKVAGLRKMASAISCFTQRALCCRTCLAMKSVKSIKENYKEAKRNLSEIRGGISVLFDRMISQVKEEIDRIGEESKRYGDCIALAEWCLEKGHLQQAATYLREGIINLVIENSGLDEDGIYERSFREKVAEVLNNLEECELRSLWREIGNIRNDINHAGFNKSPRDVKGLKEDLERLLKEVKEFVKEGKLKIDPNLLKGRKIFVRCGDRFKPPDESWEVITLPDYVNKENLKECVDIVRRRILEERSPVKLLISGPVALGVALGQALEHVPVRITYLQLNQRTKKFEEWLSNSENWRSGERKCLRREYA